MEDATVLDFDMLCSTVAMQAHKGRWGKLNGDNEDEKFVSDCHQYGGGSLECGKANLFMTASMIGGSLFNPPGDGMLNLILLSVCVLVCPCYRFGKNMKRAGFGSCLLQGGESSVDDCVHHLVCPFCTLSQESRTLEMNNVQDGIWHGRGDTICIGSFSEDAKAFLELNPRFVVSTKSPELLSMQKTSNDTVVLSASVVDHSPPLVPPPK
ncbi:UNVERIFIED_CONTAM: hypothetical protein Sradi_2211700 [Sesamum radiatum]|uniref:Uncharacterized protein n=1 Tax=Sesamum radiatum TaxID=300843 RepID=A0AAW2T230_SESRA